MVDAPAAAPAAPSTAPSSQPATDALSWMNDDANFRPGSEAEQKAYELPTPERPALPSIKSTDGLTGATDDPEKLGSDALTVGEKSARDALAEQMGHKEGTKEGEEAAEPGYSQDETGRWHRPDGAFADQNEIDAITELLAEGGNPTAPAPAAAAADKPAASKQPIGDVVIQQDGKPVEGIPPLTFTYKADGKTLENVPLDKLIRKAQLGEYNAQRDQQAESARSQFEATRTRLSEVEQANQQYEQWFNRIFTDPQFRAQAEADFARAQSPEARLQASQQQLAAIAQQQAAEASRNEATAFVQQHIAPRINALSASLPQDELTQKAFYGEIALLTTPMLVNGRVPPERLPEVVRLIEARLTPWAESVMQSRSQSESAAVTKLRQQVTAQQVALTLAKKAQARRLAPQGRTGALRESPKPLPAPKTAEEANAQMFARIEHQFGAPPG